MQNNALYAINHIMLLILIKKTSKTFGYIDIESKKN